MLLIFFFQAEDGIRDLYVTGVQTCALPISRHLPQCGPYQAVPGPQAVRPGPVESGSGPPACRRRRRELTVNLADLARVHDVQRSEERRVGKECRSRWAR